MSRTATLQSDILHTIGTQEVTIGQLLAQLQADRLIRVVAPLALLRAALRVLVRNGDVAREMDQVHHEWRYSVPQLSYCAEQTGGSRRWSVVHYDAGRFNGVILGDNFSEADARCCAAALNERDREVRSIQAKRKR